MLHAKSAFQVPQDRNICTHFCTIPRFQINLPVGPSWCFTVWFYTHTKECGNTTITAPAQHHRAFSGRCWKAPSEVTAFADLEESSRRLVTISEQGSRRLPKLILCSFCCGKCCALQVLWPLWCFPALLVAEQWEWLFSQMAASRD